jgi:restriction endonuclease S subunit
MLNESEIVPLKRAALGGLLVDGDWVETKDQDPEGPIRLVQLADIGEGALRFRSDRWLNDSAAERLRVTFLRPDDLLIARMPSPLGRCCIVPSSIGRAITVVDVAVLRIADPDINPRYVMYAVNAQSARDAIMRNASGTTRLRITRKRLSSTLVKLPRRDDQDVVARYLDHASLRIGRAVNAKRALVAMLDERRRAISQELLTRGLNEPNASQHSGIEWLGHVPAHWDIRRAKRLYREVNERSKRGEEPLLSVSHLTGVTPRTAKNVTMFMAVTYAGHKLCRPGDLVINTMWAWMGALGVAFETGLVSPSYGVYRPLADSPLEPAYADLLLRARPYIDEYTSRSTGIRASRLRLYADRFLSVPIVCPPAAEQLEIVDRVDTATRDLDVAIDSELREIELLDEYRTGLISDVVTGRRDVQAEAKALPDVDPEELDAVLSASGDDDEEEDVEE